MWPFAAPPCLSSQGIHSAAPLTYPHSQPSEGLTSSLLCLERFILACPFISFLFRLWFTILASLSLHSASYMFVFTASRFPSSKSPMSCVSLKTVGKIHPAKWPLQGPVQTRALGEHKCHFASDAGPKHRKDFQPVSNFLAQFSDPCLLLHFLYIHTRKALCPPPAVRKYDLFHLLFQSLPPQRATATQRHLLYQAVPQLQNLVLRSSCPWVCDQLATQFVLVKKWD